MSGEQDESRVSSGRQANAEDVRLGKRVALLRKSRRMPQAELARRLRVTPQQYQKYERGTNRIGATRLFEIAVTLGVQIQYFFEDLGERANAEPEDLTEVSAEDFLWILARLKNPQSRWRALRMISALVCEDEDDPSR